jgi:dTDP-4-dehydrorhamnose 3,5-epimerase
MRIDQTAIPGVVVVTPVVREDTRGAFHESWQLERYADAGLPTRWVQDNVSTSRRHVLRGLHFQNPGGQGKLVTALSGEIFDVAVDVRRSSPTFGRSIAEVLSAENHRQLYVPSGFAHGFLVLSELAIVHYKCTDYYRPEDEHSLAWHDPALDIAWPYGDPLQSEKDARAPRLADLPESVLPPLAPTA